MNRPEDSIPEKRKIIILFIITISSFNAFRFPGCITQAGNPVD
jgi:hypothetical protein